jgi:hypothetical protein
VLLYVLTLYIIVVGINIWVECSMVVFIEHLDEVGSLSCLVRIFIYIEYLGLELISAIILYVVVYPMP